jgi:hypothetical protein
MRRQKLLVALAGLAVVGAAGAVVLWPRPDRITRENYDRIRVGMSRAEVYTVLGPPGEYSTGDAKASGLPEPPMLTEDLRQAISLEEWFGDRAAIGVYFDGAGNVTSARCWLLKPIDHGPLGNLLWRLKHWRRWFTPSEPIPLSILRGRFGLRWFP